MIGPDSSEPEPPAPFATGKGPEVRPASPNQGCRDGVVTELADGSEISGRLVQLLAGRWTLALLSDLRNRDRRYQDIHEALDGISHKVLTDTLRRTERDGLISRRLDAGRVDTTTLYQLTDLGRTLDQPLGALARWVETNWVQVEAARLHWHNRSTAE